MKLYQVVDDGFTVLVTVNELEALKKFRQLMDKYKVKFGWVDEWEVK